jgi:hypothetical protein
MAASAGIPAKPRGCQHGLLGTAQAGKAEAVATNGKVVDELVDLVKQLNKGS